MAPMSLHVPACRPQARPTLLAGYWKALVPLCEGVNDLTFTVSASDPQADNSTILRVHYTPCMTAPPLHLAILVASDSLLQVDAPPDRRAEHADLEVVRRKFALQAYTWQAFTAEQMLRHRLGRRSFRLAESIPSTDGSSGGGSDVDIAELASVHILQSPRTMREIRHEDNAQQNPHGRAPLHLCSLRNPPTD